ncbi:hypothetical protein [Cupriavidus sp. TMH.W2]|uniref:hypothetical protein n=1 Tax=Cupriavidus sp. TMH.W2 TaxID=3434465 RepID=UPI003D786950
MTDFLRIWQDVQGTEAAKSADTARAAAQAAAEQATRVAQARDQFAAMGLHDYLQAQASAMQASGFWVRHTVNGVEGRAQAVLEFVPAPGEAFCDAHIGGRNTVSMIVESYGEGVSCRLYARNAVDNAIPEVPLAALALADVQAWFERFVRFGLATRQPCRA